MSEWLGVLEGRVSEMKYSSSTRYWMQHWELLYMQDPNDTRIGDLDRLIAIAELAGWGQIHRGDENGLDVYTRGCNICEARHSGEHTELVKL